MLSYITLHLYGKRLEKIYEVTVFNGKITTLIMGICFVFGARAEVSVQKFVTCLSSVVNVAQ